MRVAIGMTHGHAPKWLQVVLSSLKRFDPGVEADVFVACSWPGHPSVRAGSETPLGEGVTFFDCTRRLHNHATGLEHILELAAQRGGYDYLFACETDCAAQRAGWLREYVDAAEAKKAGITGFFWEEGDHHYNINPSATLYRMDMLETYHAEVHGNKEGMFWHPKGNKRDDEPGMDPSIKDVVGVFAETRGIKEPTAEQLEYILGGVPEAAWWEPGQWVYVRSRGEWPECRLPCEHAYTDTGVVTTPEGTFYGGREAPYFIHYWGGTRAYDFLKHPVECGFVKGGAPWWLAREDRIWREAVSEGDRAIVHDLIREAGTEAKMQENLGVVIPEAL